ncbi:ankyrin repeat-containing domain protein [Hypoxylon rubiginosum]|uniref:Ankyrin repeat-containing domain protein n=1 Tax=Hypoxylon rubiginosum TaxID=110542 RepID=A0ACB9ZF42_9PEZI|nr:ankyrin repeat-containing domain protein [Hypoxylon rubiginosum]
MESRLSQSYHRPFLLPDIGESDGASMPQLTAVRIHGIDGSTFPQITEFQVLSDWDVISFTYNIEYVIGECANDDSVRGVAIDLLQFLLSSKHGNTASFTFFAYDLGGTIVHEALVIASLDEKYKTILCRTNMTVFYGFAHQATRDQSFEVNTLQTLQHCYPHILGPWLGSILTWFSWRRERLSLEFKALAVRFRVLSYVQDLTIPSPHILVTHKSCARIGVPSEEVVTMDRGHYLLGFPHGYREERLLKKIIDYAHSENWSKYQLFLNTLRIAHGTSVATPGRLGEYKSVPTVRVSLEAIINNWVSVRTDTKSLHLCLSGRVSPTELVSMVETALHAEHPSISENILLIRYQDSSRRNIIPTWQLYAWFCAQILEQRPTSIRGVTDLYYSVRDAILGSDQNWKERCLLRCLRTLLLEPVTGHIFCVIYDQVPEPINPIINLLSTIQVDSEIRLRLMVVSETDRVGSESGLACLKPTDLALTETLPASTIPSIKSSPDTSKVLSKAIEDYGVWVLTALAWAKYSVRSLTCAEFAHVLEIEIKSNSENKSLSHIIPIDGKLIIGILQSLFRGIQVWGGVIFVEWEPESVFNKVWEKNLPQYASPHHFIAESCLTLLEALYRKNNHGDENNHSVFGKERESEVKPEIGSSGNTRRELCMPNQNASIRDGILEYASRHWFLHWSLASGNGGQGSQSSLPDLNILQSHPEFDADLWIGDLASISWCGVIPEELRSQISRNSLSKRFNLSATQALSLSFQLASTPLCPTDDIDSIVLSQMKPIVNCATFSRAVQEICGSGTYSQEQYTHLLINIIAASTGTLRSELISTHSEFSQLNSQQILLASLAMGYNGEVKELMEATTALTPSNNIYEPTPIVSKTPMEVACEYGDIDILKILLREGSPWRQMACPLRQRLLSVAVTQGYTEIVLFLLSIPETPPTSNVCSLDDDPLYLACARGLIKVVDPLCQRISETEDVAIKDRLYASMCAAAESGFLHTLKTLPEPEPSKLEPSTTTTGPNEPNSLILYIRAHFSIYEGEMLEYGGADNEETQSQYSSENREELSPDPEEDADYFPRTWWSLILLEGARTGWMSLVGRSQIAFADKDTCEITTERTPLIIAARNGFARVVRILLKSGANLVMWDSNGKTALHHACEQGHLSVVELLLEESSSQKVLEREDNFSRTPGEGAIMYGHHHILKSLLNLMKDEVKDEYCKKYFAFAANIGMLRAMETILDFVTDLDRIAVDSCINIANNRELNTPLHCAASNNKTRAVQMLLLRGARIELLNAAGDSALGAAAMNGSTAALKVLLDAEVVKLLLDYGARPELCDHWAPYESLLAFISTNSSPEVLRVVLNYYESIREARSSKIKQQWASSVPKPAEAFRILMSGHQLPMVEVLLDVWNQVDDPIIEKGINVGTPLHYAARLNSRNGLRVLKRLLLDEKVGSQVNTLLGHFGTPLQAAIQGGSYDLRKVEILLDRGALVDREGGVSGTALNAAAETLNVEIAKKILERLESLKFGKYHVAAGRYGTPFQAAVVGMAKHERPESFEDMLSLLATSAGNGLLATSAGNGLSAATTGGFYHTALHAAVFLSSSETIRRILALDGSSTVVDVRDAMGRLPLHGAATQNWELVKNLSSNDSTVRSKDFQGRSAIHFAAASGAKSVVDRILSDSENCDLVDEPDIDGWTPLHWACRTESEETVALLISYNADKTFAAKNGWLPYHVAVFHGRSFADTVKPKEDWTDEDRSQPAIERAICLTEKESCSCCQCALYGRYYSCKSDEPICEGFKLCFKCHTNVGEIHDPCHAFTEFGHYV